MDNISAFQKKMMEYGGNKKLMEFFSLYRLDGDPKETRYYSKACQLYRERLKMMA